MSRCDCEELIAGSTNSVRLLNLTDDDGEHRDDATVTVTIKNYAGQTVSGADAVEMPYEGGTDLKYEGKIPSNASLVAETRYKVYVTATIPGVGSRTFTVRRVAKE